jgi:hypothetical protein
MPKGPFLALITPLTGGGDGGGEPPVPTHPIVIPPGQPPQPTHPIAGGPWPTPPIYYPPGTGPGQPPSGGGVPPGYWGGVAPPLPTHPIAPGGPPPQPTHPIVIPPDAVAPGVPTHPIYIPVFPAHPIVLPPDGGPPPEEMPKLEVKVGWTQETGWVVVIVPTGPTITPSR